MNDNRVSISTELDNSGIEKGAGEIKGELGGVEGAVNDLRDALDAAFSGDFDKSIANANARVNELQRQLSTASIALKDAIAAGDDAAAEKYGNQRIRIYDQLEAARERLTNAVRAAAQKEAEAEAREAKKTTKAKQKEVEKQQKAALKPVKRFTNRLRSIVSGALVFNLLSAGLRTMTQYFGAALKSNQQFTASVAKLKGALMTAFQPIYEAALPALLALMRVLTAVIQVIGQFLAMIFGKSTSQMAKNAEALNKEANAIKGVGGAAKEAKKQLAGFDEINKLNADNAGGGGGGTSSIAPDFEPIELAGGLEYVKYLIGAVGAALLTWKLASAFGTVGAAGGLLIGGLITATLALIDWIKTGELSNAGCVALTLGILAIGAAISLLTGSWIPLLIAAITAFVVAAITKPEELKKALSDFNNWLQGVFQKDWTKVFGFGLGTSLNALFALCSGTWQAITDILSGVIDFIAGIFADDWNRAWTGVRDVFKGIVNGIISLVNGMVRAVVNGLNAVIRALNRIHVTIPEWVPGYGGKNFGFNLGEISAPQIPLLAQGAVIPPNAPFMAMLGDQRHGTNIEAPLSTIQEAVALVMEDYAAANLAGHEATVAVLREILEAVLGIEIGDDVLGRAVGRYNARLATMRGDG